MSFFLPYQKKWILDNSRIKLMEKSRQIGMSWTSAYSLVRRHAIENQKHDSWVSSRDEMQASLFVQDCKKFSEILNLACIELEKKNVSDEKNSTTKILQFKNGTKINSLSSNPDAQAGKRGSRILDEFALHPDPAKLYSIAYPGITWGGQLEIISTHRGADNFFNKLLLEAKHVGNPKKISLHKVTLQDALEQGFLLKLKNALSKENPIQEMDDAQYFDYIKNSCADEESFLQEYMCEPTDYKSSFINFDILYKNFYREEDAWEMSPDCISNPMYLGIDIARAKDLSVFWLLEKSHDTFYTRQILTFKDTPFSEQESVLYSFLKNPNVVRASIDNTGIGRQFAERAKERYGASRIDVVNFTNSTKEALAYNLKSLLEDCKLRIPDTDEIRADFRSLKKTSSLAGNIRFTANHTNNGHADRFWALALALDSASQGRSFGEINLVDKPKYLW